MTAPTAPGNAGVGSWIARRARAAPEGVALIAGDWSVTYAELADQIRRLAKLIRAELQEAATLTPPGRGE